MRRLSSRTSGLSRTRRLAAIVGLSPLLILASCVEFEADMSEPEVDIPVPEVDAGPVPPPSGAPDVLSAARSDKILRTLEPIAANSVRDVRDPPMTIRRIRASSLNASAVWSRKVMTVTTFPCAAQAFARLDATCCAPPPPRLSITRVMASVMP